MSPAKKRKPARRAASGGGRGPAPAAGRKAMGGKGAGRKPAGRGAARDAGRCTLPPRRLAGLLDGAERAELLAHVPACGACSTTLTTIAAASQGLQRMSFESVGGTAVERILARGVRLGDRKLADLVYEMAKACLVVVQDIDRRLHLATRPRDAAVIDREVLGVTARLPMRLREAASALPHGKPDESQALGAAESCVRILERVEGASERQRLAKSVWLICAGRASEAEGVLRGMLGEGRSRCGMHAYRNLLWALVRQEKYDEVVRTGEKALAAFPDDWDCVFNVAIGAANSGDVRRFRAVTRHLRSLPTGSASERRIRLPLMKYESPRLAGPLGVTVRSIETAFGITPAAAGVRHAVD